MYLVKDRSFFNDHLELKYCVLGYLLDPGGFPWNGNTVESLSVGGLVTGMIKIDLTIHLHGYKTRPASVGRQGHVIIM
jgi:hypothetical protein